MLSGKLTIVDFSSDTIPKASGTFDRAWYLMWYYSTKGGVLGRINYLSFISDASHSNKQESNLFSPVGFN